VDVGERLAAVPVHPFKAQIGHSRCAAGLAGLIKVACALHTGTRPGYAQVLVRGGSPGALAALAAAHPGWHLAGRNVANAEAAAANAQDNFANNLILGVIATLCAVSLITTLAVATGERRRSLRLLGCAGATRGQATAVFGWHAVFVIVTGLIAGVAAGALTMLAVTRAVTGSWALFIPATPAAGLVAGITVLTLAAVLIPFRLMLAREPAFSPG